ncbi:RecB family exonuclease [Trueperella bialowiezensis]|uniref:Inactivated superfamily I helicase n=1 Tax=Trueperella bialowiezensis TaxID=312285 RepID=A0A3S4VRW7_9ACTO|nr:PD-(D/E)XK nuclease family protein [Trueperella bialowiezensis]VEI12375.1 Inactivated superfamily I helicase [Trueperella bialowiezensis]
MTRHAALSPSRTADFKNCPLKFRFRVIDRLPEPPSLAALRGTIVHSVLEHLYDSPATERTPERAQELLEPAWHTHVEKDPSVLELFESERDQAEWLGSARPLIANYFHLENPQFLEPDARESFVNAVLPSGLAIRGIIDRIDRAPNGQLRLVDYKTGKSPAPRFQSEALFQMRFYATALYHSDAVLPARTQLIYLKDGRVLTYDPHPDDVAALAMEVDSIWSAIRGRIDSGVFEPSKGPLCNWCHFQDVCPAYGNTPPEMSESGVKQLLTAEVGKAS